jgi:hypothetical protein
VTTELLDAEESAIEDGDGGGGIGVAAGATGGATAVVLGLLVICLLRRCKQKRQLVTLESSNGASSSTLPTTVNKTTLDTGDNVASGSASLHVANLAPVWPPRRTALPTTKVQVHLDLEKDQLQPPVSRASSSAGAARSSRDDDPRKAQRAAIEAAAAAVEDSEASEADEVQRDGHSPQPRKKWLGGSPAHKPILYSSEI